MSAYIEQFDVCLIPFKINDLTLNSCPIKLFDYFTFGKPVVSTELGEVKKFQDLLYIADKDNITNQIKKALIENDPILVDRRKEIANEYSWDIIVENILKIIGASYDLGQ